MRVAMETTALRRSTSEGPCELLIVSWVIELLR